MNVFLSDEQSIPTDTAGLRTLAEHVLRFERYPAETEVTIMLVTDEVMADYNARFMEREGSTDVLAFPLDEHRPGTPPVVRQGSPPVTLGDVIIAPDHVGRQAGAAGVEFGDEMALMVVHGILHLMGYDHADDPTAERMEGRERAILDDVGISQR